MCHGTQTRATCSVFSVGTSGLDGEASLEACGSSHIYEFQEHLLDIFHLDGRYMDEPLNLEYNDR